MDQKSGRYQWENETAKLWRVQYVDRYSDQSAVLYIDKAEAETEDEVRTKAMQNDHVARIADIREIDVKVDPI